MARYVENNLLKNEKVVFETTYHWVHFISWISLFTLGIWPYIQMKTDEFVVTSRRIVIKKGVFAYETLEMNLNRVETVHVEQGILGRILGYGRITVIGTGGTRETFDLINRPVEFRRNFQEII